MVKPELGTKRVCVSCSARFYDLMKSPAVCPKCGTEQPVEQPRTRRPVGNLIDEKRKKPQVVPDEAEADTDEADDADAADDTTDEADALEDDSDAIADEIEIDPEEP